MSSPFVVLIDAKFEGNSDSFYFFFFFFTCYIAYSLIMIMKEKKKKKPGGSPIVALAVNSGAMSKKGNIY